MEKIGDIQIRVVGKSGNIALNPDNYDIKHIASLLQNVEDLLYPNNKKGRPIITYDIKQGSVLHVFKTSLQAVIGFNAILSQIRLQNNIDFLELKTARALEEIQKISWKKNYEFQIKTSLAKNFSFNITSSTGFIRTKTTWVDAELYFYGMLKDVGGKNKANVHLDTDDYGYLSIETEEGFLKKRKENLLYKNYGVRAMGKQNVDTGEIDPKSLKLMELIDYDPKFDNEYLETLIVKAKKNWKGINAEDWLTDMRGAYEA